MATDAPVPRLALSVQECCEAIGCSRHYFTEHVAAELPMVRRGRKRLVPVSVLERWLVEAALVRLGDRRLTLEEQRVVVQATRTPSRVRWPDWWQVKV